MLKNLPLAPEDPILGLTEAFKREERLGKINIERAGGWLAGALTAI